MTVELLASANPLTHVQDHIWARVGHGWTSFTLISNHLVMMILAAVILLIALPRLARLPDEVEEVEKLTPRGGRNFVELICQFLRDFVGKPNLGPYCDRFIPYLWTCFFFIVTCNLLGLLPLGPITKLLFGVAVFGTATGNIFMTSGLALCTLVMIFFHGLRLHKLNYVKHFFIGPFPINLLIAGLEAFGLLVKCAALAIRLFANMLAGHILLAVLLSFIAMAGAASIVLGIAVAVPVVLGSVAITLLEIFVAFLQAFIFTFLSAVFIGMAVNIEHEENHAESDVDVRAEEAAIAVPSP